MDKLSPVSTVSISTLGLTSRCMTMALYVVIVFLYWLALYLYVPILPTYVQGKVKDLALVGVILSMYGLWQALIRLPLGIAADWLGRRKPFIVICLQLFLGLTQGINYPVLMGLSIRYVGEAERTTAMGLHQAVYAVGMFAGPWLSGMLASAIGLRPMLGVTAAACLILGWLLTAAMKN